MSFDLRFEPWIPFRRRSGKIFWGAPSQLTEDLTEDPVVAIAAPRPDFTGALTEFLIGLMSYALAPEDENDWLDLWRNPPPPETLHEKLAALPDAFQLDGDGPRFLQDFTPADLPDANNDIEGLLIDAAGGQTVKFNKDLFIKRCRIPAMGRPAVAMALLTLQTYAPSGGQGHRTSMRGGGPLTTLIDPRVDQAAELPLWQYIWANAETEEQWQDRGPDMVDGQAETVFPWLAPTKASDPKAGGKPVTPQDGHPMQAYFGMPRRIHLAFEAAPDGHCDLTGRPAEVLARQYATRNYGVEYDVWQHPLTPYYKDAKGQSLPTHGQPGGFCWRDWAGLLYAAPDGKKQPAQAVVQFLNARARAIGVSRPRLHVFGYDMDNMKARGWVESLQPALALDQAQTNRVAPLAQHLADATDCAASMLLMAVKSAKFDRPGDVKGDMSLIKTRLWDATESAFYRMVELAAGDASLQDLQAEFLPILTRTVEALFDAFCPSEGMEFTYVRRYVSAQHSLRLGLRGYGKMGGKLFTALEIPAPEKKSKRKKKGAAA